jgi:hypothetical protein
MSDQTAATLYFLAPFALIWLAFTAVETRRVLAAIRGRK